MTYTASETRYDTMQYRRCGESGILLPLLSLGMWHNFGGVDVFENYRKILWKAFDSGITHFDLANNYGPPPGSAEENFGTLLNKDFAGHRDEMIISSKAGYDMWQGPYGNWGSKKSLIASLDQSLQRMGLEYVDIFYSHRHDPETPLEETMDALAQIVRQGKALYVGLSKYPVDKTKEAFEILKRIGVKCLIYQPRYSMFDRTVEEGLLDVLDENGVGCIPFSPLAQGLLTNKYLKGIPEGSRASREGFLKSADITEEKLNIIKQLNEMALNRGQSLAQMAISWLLKDKRVTTVLVGASSPEQLGDNIKAVDNFSFSVEELEKIDGILKGN